VPPTDKLPLTLSFSNTNGTSLTQPAHLQQLQAALGCTLQVPLESVVIMNISHIINGFSTPIPFDRSAANLKSNGTIVCLVPRVRRLLMHRQLDPIATSSVAVEIDILLPPENLALLNSTELASLIEGSSSLQLVATTTGSGGISLLAAPGTADSQPMVTGSAPAASSSNLSLIVGLSVFSGCCVIMTATVTILYYRLRQKPITSHSKNIIIVDAPFSQTIRTAQPDNRVEFSPRNIETVIRRP